MSVAVQIEMGSRQVRTIRDAERAIRDIDDKLPDLIDAVNDAKLRAFGDLEPFKGVIDEGPANGGRYVGTELPAKNRRAVTDLWPRDEDVAKLDRYQRSAYGRALANLRKRQGERAQLADFIADRRSDEYRLAKAKMADIPKRAKAMRDEVDATRELAAKFVAAAVVILDPTTRARLFRIAQFPAAIKQLRREAAVLADDKGFDVPEIGDIELPPGLIAALEGALRKSLR